MSDYCTEHDDPLLWAATLTCVTCGRCLVPVEAAWWDGDQVLASYRRGCSHLPDTIAIVPARRLQPGDLDDPPRQQCTATARSTGRQCRNLARPGAEHCANHQGGAS